MVHKMCKRVKLAFIDLHPSEANCTNIFGIIQELSMVNMLLPKSCSSIDISSTFIVKRWVRSWVQDSLAECVIYQLKRELVVGGFG